MSITVFPYKLTQRELEARLEPGLTVLPGQYLRFGDGEPVFGQVREVSSLPAPSPGLMGGYGLTISLLYGTPSLQPQPVAVLNAAQMAQAVQRLQEPLQQPLKITPSFSAEFSRLGAMTLIGGDDFVQKFEALQLFVRAIQPFRRLVIFDPLGVFAEEDGVAYWEAGKNVRLSAQTVGSKQFLATFGELLAPGLRETALRAVADHLPTMQDFLGFRAMMEWYAALNLPLKNLILQSLQEVANSRIFADSPEQVLDWSHVAQHPITVFNLSLLEEPWRGLCYREAFQSLMNHAGDQVTPVLIYPENYLPDLQQWIQKADESEIHMLMLASPYVSDTLLEMANNRFWTESAGRYDLKGPLTLGIPLQLSLSPSTQAAPSHYSSSKEGAKSKATGPVGNFSSFGVPIVDDAVGQDDVSQAPQHWLGEAAAEPEDWEEAALGRRSGQTQGDLGEAQEAISSPEALSTFGASELANPEVQVLNDHSVIFSQEDVPIRQRQSENDMTGPLQDDEIALAQSDSMAGDPFQAKGQAEDYEFMSASALSELLATGEMANPEDHEDEPAPLHPKQPPVVADSRPTMHAAEDAPPSQIPEPAELSGSGAQAETVSADGGFWEPEAPSSALSEQNPDEFNFDLTLFSEAETQSEPEMPPEPSLETYSETHQTHFDAFSEEETDFDEFAGLDLSLADSVSDFSHADAAQPGLAQTEHAAFDQIMPDPERYEFESHTAVTQPTKPTSIKKDIVGRGEKRPSRLSRTGIPQNSAITATDKDLDDALDLIFPNHSETGEETPTHREPAPQASSEVVSDEKPLSIVPKATAPSTSDPTAFHPGDRVKHATYGTGVVQKVIPMENGVVLNITFDLVGKRLLDPTLSALARDMME